jgi:hypothetical protein
MVKFSEIISASIEWATTVLFKPFVPKKWLILGFSALLAGYLSGSGCHANNWGNSNTKKSQKAVAAQNLKQAPAQETKKPEDFDIKKARLFLLNELKNPFSVASAIAVLLVVLGGILLITWLHARFSFVFLENVVNNDASIRMPFRAYAGEGDSFFLLSMLLCVIFMAIFISLGVGCFLALGKIGFFAKASPPAVKTIILTCLPYGLGVLALMILGVVVDFIVYDFAPVVMFSERISARQGVLKILSLVKVNLGDVTGYFFIKLGLKICASIICGMISLGVFFGLLLPGGLVVLAGVGIYHIIPKLMHMPFLVLAWVLGIPVLAFVFYCRQLFYLPFGVFFRTFSLKFLARLDSRYNLFQLNAKRG